LLQKITPEPEPGIQTVDFHGFSPEPIDFRGSLLEHRAVCRPFFAESLQKDIDYPHFLY